MRKISIKQLLAGGVVVTVAAVSLFGVETLPQYKTTTLAVGSVKKEIDFTTNWYPQGYAKLSLGDISNVRQVQVKVGQSVSKNKVLAQLVDDTEYNQYKAAQAGYYAAIKAKKNAAASPLTPSSTLDTLQGQINSAYYQVKNAEVALNKKKVKSPIAGKVIEIQLSDYSTAGAASSSLALAGAGSSADNYIVVANTNEAIFSATVSERDIARLEKEMKVQVATRVSETKLSGKIVSVGKIPVVAGAEDPTYEILVKLDTYPKELAFGTKFEGSVVIFDKSDVKLVQYDAVTIDSAEKGSVLVEKNGKIETVSVDIGVVGDDAVEVKKGIGDTERIVIDQLSDKKIVTVRPWVKKLLRIN